MKRREYKPRVERKCEMCGKVFLLWAHRLKRKPGKYCSIKCALEARRKPKTILPCGTCGKKLTLSPNQLKERGKFGHFCSHKCYGIWRTNNLSGENSPNWKGGYTLDYGGHHWKRQRSRALKRDKSICQECGKEGAPDERKMDVHHIKSYDMFDDPEKANRLRNLRTLCKKCHSKFHPINELQKKSLLLGRNRAK